MNELRLATRQLLKSPGFTAVAVLTLALGIGATTAIFSVVNAVLLKPLDYPQSEQLVQVMSRHIERGHFYTVSYPDFEDWRAAATSFAGMARYSANETAVGANGVAETAGTAQVSDDFFRVLNVPLRAGRHFDENERRVGGAAVVSEDFARRHFRDAAGALGEVVSLFGKKFTVVGVMPGGFRFPGRTEIWLPVDTIFPVNTNRTSHNYRVVARLKSGVAVERAHQELDQIAAQLRVAHPNANSTKGAAVLTLHELTVRNHRSTLWILLGAVALLLLLACANVANLFLARGASRSREVAVRAALGGSTWQIVRMLLAEAALLSIVAAGLGALLAWGGTKLLVAFAPRGVPRLEATTIDALTLVFTVVTAGIVCALAGLMPTWQSARPNLNLALRAGGNKGMIGGTGHRLRSGLVVAQLAISLLLLCGAGLFVRSLRNLELVDPGYRSDGLLVTTANFPVSEAADYPRAAAFFAELVREARTLPGVSSVSYTQHLPIDATGSNGTYFLEERQNLPNSEWDKYSALWRIAGPGYFETMGIRIVRGRGIDERDQFGATPVIVVNESMAKMAWPGEDPIGRRLRIGWTTTTNTYLTVIGVSADIKAASLDAPSPQELFISAPQHPPLLSRLKVVTRTAGDPTSLTEPMRQIARRLNADVPVQFTTATILIEETMAAPRFRTVLIAVFAGVALVLALVGVASVLACMVTERRTEIGIRMALGALPGNVVADFVRRGAKLAVLGLAVGLAGAFFASRLLQGLLFGVSAGDPLIFAGVGALLLFAALVASAIPASRAAKVDPLVVLRSD